MKRRQALHFVLLLVSTILPAGCGRDPRHAPAEKRRALVLYYNKIRKSYLSLRRAAGAKEPSFYYWRRQPHPLLLHLPIWLKGTVAVRARIARLHDPLLPGAQQSFDNHENFVIVFKLQKGQHVPSRGGVTTIKLYHGCLGMVSPVFMGDRRVGEVWRIAFTPKGEAIGVIPNGPYRAPKPDN